jgi:hypothetical protein
MNEYKSPILLKEFISRLTPPHALAPKTLHTGWDFFFRACRLASALMS